MDIKDILYLVAIVILAYKVDWLETRIKHCVIVSEGMNAVTVEKKYQIGTAIICGLFQKNDGKQRDIQVLTLEENNEPRPGVTSD